MSSIFFNEKHLSSNLVSSFMFFSEKSWFDLLILLLSFLRISYYLKTKYCFTSLFKASMQHFKSSWATFEKFKRIAFSLSSFKSM